jgi:hypothetical protein
MNDFDTLKADLRERFLAKAERIIKEFNGKIDLVEDLKDRIDELKK